MTRTSIGDLYRCQVCHEWRYIPTLARECETRHQNSEDQPHGI